MHPDIAIMDLRLRRRTMLLYAIGMAAYTYIIVAMYPSMRNDTALSSFLQGNEKAAALFGVTGSLTSPGGWINGNLYANFLPLLVLLLTIGYGAASIAGQAETGLLGVIATLPVSRSRLVAEKALAMALVALPMAVATTGLVLLGRFYQLDLGVWPVIGTTVAVALLGVDFGLLALAVGAATGRRSTAMAVAATTGAVSYVVSSLAPVTATVRPLRALSLFYWAVGNDQLDRGPSATGFAVLLAVGAVLLAIGMVGVQRLDIP